MVKYDKTQPHTIQDMFNSIAKRYDLTNSVLSLNMHKKWNRELVRQTCLPNHPEHLLDLCSGTGDIASEYLRMTQQPCQMYLIDFSSEMLNVAREKIKSLKISSHQCIHTIEADVQSLPLGQESMDCATMAYGIRNVKDPAKCIADVFRVLRPGARFGILELTQPTNPLLKICHQFYLKTFVPVLGKWITANQGAYQYLRNSIRTFISPLELQRMLYAAGFDKVEKHTLSAGIATLLVATK